MRLTQRDGKAIMHAFIIASVLPSRWVLGCDYTHLVLVLLCIRTYHLIIFSITELPFCSSKTRWALEWDYTRLVLVLICIRTYILTACFILNSRLSLCTATSMRATAPSLSALAVNSMRPVQCCPCFCISARRISILHTFMS